MQTFRCGKPKANPEFGMRNVECDTGLGSAGPSTHVHTNTHYLSYIYTVWGTQVCFLFAYGGSIETGDETE